MYYEVSGSGEPIMFIHGLGSSAEDWKIQTEFFSRHFKVITYDVRGHGKTDSSDYQYSIPLFAEDCAALLRHLEVDSAHIVGLSLGGLIAFQLVISHPHLVKSLGIVNSLPEVNINTLKTRVKIYGRLLLVRFFGLRVTGKVLSKKLFPRPEMDMMRKDFIEKWAKNDKIAYLHSVKAMIGWSVADKLHTITCPVLFITSEFDYTSIAAKEHFAQKISNAQLAVIKDAKHAVTVEKAQEFNATLYEFLQN